MFSIPHTFIYRFRRKLFNLRASAITKHTSNMHINEHCPPILQHFLRNNNIGHDDACKVLFGKHGAGGRIGICGGGRRVSFFYNLAMLTEAGFRKHRCGASGGPTLEPGGRWQKERGRFTEREDKVYLTSSHCCAKLSPNCRCKRRMKMDLRNSLNVSADVKCSCIKRSQHSNSFYRDKSLEWTRSPRQAWAIKSIIYKILHDIYFL